jgi:hypothetical protein
MGPIFVVLQVTVEWPSMCPKGEQNRIGLLLQCPPSPRKCYGARVQRTSAGMPLKVVHVSNAFVENLLSSRDRVLRIDDT